MIEIFSNTNTIGAIKINPRTTCRRLSIQYHWNNIRKIKLSMQLISSLKQYSIRGSNHIWTWSSRIEYPFKIKVQAIENRKCVTSSGDLVLKCGETQNMRCSHTIYVPLNWCWMAGSLSSYFERTFGYTIYRNSSKAKFTGSSSKSMKKTCANKRIKPISDAIKGRNQMKFWFSTLPWIYEALLSSGSTVEWNWNWNWS